MQQNYITNTDQTANIGRFMAFFPDTNKITLNNVPNTPSIGVLRAVYNLGAIQIGYVESESWASQLATDGVAYNPGDQLVNDANGRGTKATAGQVAQAVVIRAVTAGAVGQLVQVAVMSTLDQSAQGSLLPIYWVAPPSTPTVTNPPSRFASIQAAINQAAVDGHTAAAPAAIFVYPGTYNENLIMQDGISVVGLSMHASADTGLGATSSGYFEDVIIQGTMGVQAACTKFGVQGVVLNGVGGAAVDFGAAANLTQVNFRDCLIRCAIIGSSCITGHPGGTPTIGLERCQLLNTVTQGGNAGISFSTAVNVQMLEVSIQPNVGTDNCISAQGGTWVARGISTFFGVIANVAAATVFLLTDVDHVVTGATSYINVTAGGPTFTERRVSRTGSTAATPYTGTFTLNSTDAQGDTNSETILATMTTGPSARSPHLLTAAATVGAAVTAAQFLAAGDVVIVNTSGGAGSVALPPRAQVKKGSVRWIVASPAGANAITMTPNGAETINGANATLATSAVVANGPSMALMADPNNTTNWLVLSRS